MGIICYHLTFVGKIYVTLSCLGTLSEITSPHLGSDAIEVPHGHNQGTRAILLHSVCCVYITGYQDLRSSKFTSHTVPTCRSLTRPSPGKGQRVSRPQRPSGTTGTDHQRSDTRDGESSSPRAGHRGRSIRNKNNLVIGNLNLGQDVVKLL